MAWHITSTPSTSLKNPESINTYMFLFICWTEYVSYFIVKSILMYVNFELSPFSRWIWKQPSSVNHLHHSAQWKYPNEVLLSAGELSYSCLSRNADFCGNNTCKLWPYMLKCHNILKCSYSEQYPEQSQDKIEAYVSINRLHLPF